MDVWGLWLGTCCHLSFSLSPPSSSPPPTPPPSDPNGCVYQSVVALHGQMAVEGYQALPRSLLLKLPIGEGELGTASVVPLDEAHIAVVGVPHPSAGSGKGEY